MENETGTIPVVQFPSDNDYLLYFYFYEQREMQDEYKEFVR